MCDCSAHHVQISCLFSWPTAYEDGEMYDGVVTPEYVDEYGNVQNGEYMGRPPSAMYGNRWVIREWNDLC